MPSHKESLLTEYIINMKKITTIICFICFAIGGFTIAATKHAALYNKTAVAATPQVVMQYPKDLLLGHKNNVGLTTVHDTIRDTVPLEICCVGSTKTVYKTKWRTKKVIVPDTIERQAPIDVDTIRISKPVILMPEAKTDSVSL